jgi:hypothetical protein
LVGNGNAYSQRGQINARVAGTYVMKNNIILNGAGPYELSRVGTVTFTSDYNSFYNSLRALSFQHVIGTYNFTDYKTTSSQDAHSIIVNPKLLDVTNRDLRLQVSSPVIDAGTNVGLTTDFILKPITGLPDLGAYEYHSLSTQMLKVNGKMVVYKGKFLY